MCLFENFVRKFIYFTCKHVPSLVSSATYRHEHEVAHTHTHTHKQTNKQTHIRTHILLRIISFEQSVYLWLVNLYFLPRRLTYFVEVSFFFTILASNLSSNNQVSTELPTRNSSTSQRHLWRLQWPPIVNITRTILYQNIASWLNFIVSYFC